jgi:hypothetical protein
MVHLHLQNINNGKFKENDLPKSKITASSLKAKIILNMQVTIVEILCWFFFFTLNECYRFSFS